MIAGIMTFFSCCGPLGVSAGPSISTADEGRDMRLIGAIAFAPVESTWLEKLRPACCGGGGCVLTLGMEGAEAAGLGRIGGWCFGEAGAAVAAAGASTTFEPLGGATGRFAA